MLFSPRLGFNWDFYGDRSLQIRGGTGIFTGRVPYVWIVGQAANSGMLQVNTFFNAANGIARPGPFQPYHWVLSSCFTSGTGYCYDKFSNGICGGFQDAPDMEIKSCH